jgi:hypothetical protein
MILKIVDMNFSPAGSRERDVVLLSACEEIEFHSGKFHLLSNGEPSSIAMQPLWPLALM